MQRHVQASWNSKVCEREREREGKRKEWLIGPRAQTIKNLGCLDPVAQMAGSTRTTRNSQELLLLKLLF
jgi:hypothetical protein